MTDTDACLACDAGETECLETGGCCVSCDHRPELDDSAIPDDVALPGLEHDQDRQWSKTQSGYLMLIAKWQTGCVGCDRRIEPGEEMERAGTGWVHVECDPGFSDAYQHQAIVGPVCPKCWLERSLSGECGCPA